MTKNNKKNNKNNILKFKKYLNSLSIKFIICTATVTLISVLSIGLFSFLYISNSINEEITRYNTQRLSYVKETVDNRVFGKSLNILSELLVKNEFNELLYYYLQHPKPNNLSKIKSVMTILKNKAITNSDILSSVSIYYKNNDIVISSSSGLKYLNDTNKTLPFDDEWIDIFNNMSKDNKGNIKNVIWLPTRETPCLDSYTANEYNISIIGKFPQNYTQDGYDSLLCLNISEKSIRNTINDIVKDDEINVLMVDSKGNVMSDNNGKSICSNISDSDIFNVINQDSGTNVIETKPLVEIDGIETVISSVKSDYCDWYYILMAPSSIYFQKTVIARRIIFTLCVIIFFILLFAVMLISVKLTYPFNRILVNAKNVLGEKHSKVYKNELLCINDALNMLSQKSSVQEKILNGNRDLVRQTFFLNLISGQKCNDDDVKKTLEFLGMDMSLPYFTVAIVQNNMFAKGDSLFSKIENEIYHYIDDRVYDYINRDLNIICIKSDEHHISLIINHLIPSPKIAVDFTNNLKEYIEKRFDAILHYSIGTVCNKINWIDRSFYNAYSALVYSSIYPTVMVFEYELTQEWDKNDNLEYRYINSFIKSLNEYRLDNCKQYLYIIMNNVIEEHLSYKTYKNIINEIILSIEKLVINTKIDLSEIFSTSIADQVESQYYIIDVFKTIECILEKLLDHIVSQHSGLNTVYVAEAKKFIEEYYYKDISIQDIADKLNISRHHLCRVFKETTANTLLNYITEVRMNKAKELLAEGKLTVNDIAKEIGFNNTTYFNKKFKQNFGITPTQYQSNIAREKTV